MSLFVTGSESFIGKNLIARCDATGAPVAGMDAAAPSSGRFAQADICDPSVADLIPEGATVVHLAAISRDPDCRADPKRAFQVNMEGTLNLADAARRRKAKQFIFASSEWVYGDVRNDETQVETQPIDLTAMKSEYAISKLAAEQVLRLSFSDLPVSVLRFGIVYGPRDTNWSAFEAMCSNVYKGADIKVGSARTARRFIHVDDIVSGILSSRGQAGFGIYNLSGDRLISLGDVVRTTAAMLGRQAEIQESDPDRPSIRNPDNSAAKAALNWAPAINLEAGIQSLLDHFSASK